jgi:hypothetical protein
MRCRIKYTYSRPNQQVRSESSKEFDGYITFEGYHDLEEQIESTKGRIVLMWFKLNGVDEPVSESNVGQLTEDKIIRVLYKVSGEGRKVAPTVCGRVGSSEGVNSRGVLTEMVKILGTLNARVAALEATMLQMK